MTLCVGLQKYHLFLAGSEKSLVQASQMIRIATAIFPTLSLLNHSCCPNTSLVFSTGADPPASVSSPGGASAEGRSSRGVTAAVRAANLISAGQEVLHCYGGKTVAPTDWLKVVGGAD